MSPSMTRSMGSRMEVSTPWYLVFLSHTGTDVSYEGRKGRLEVHCVPSIPMK